MYLFTKKKQRGKKSSRSRPHRKAGKDKYPDKGTKKTTLKEFVTLNLGPLNFHMNENGNWKTGGIGKTESIGEDQQINELETNNMVLAAQNNMIRLKNEILNHTITRKRIETVKMREEIEKLQKVLSLSPLRFRETDYTTGSLNKSSRS